MNRRHFLTAAAAAILIPKLNPHAQAAADPLAGLDFTSAAIDIDAGSSTGVLTLYRMDCGELEIIRQFDVELSAAELIASEAMQSCDGFIFSSNSLGGTIGDCPGPPNLHSLFSMSTSPTG